MIRNHSLLESFERSLVRQDAADYRRNLRIFECLYREAHKLGVTPLKDALDGSDSDICLAGVLNDRRVASTRCSRPAGRT